MKQTIFFAVIALVFFMAGCTGATNPDQIVFPATNVSYAQHIEPYFALACVSCHDGSESGVPDLSSWTEIRADLGVVVLNPSPPPLGDTTASSLALVMNGKVLHTPPVNANVNQREGVTQWVLQGGPNN